MLTDIRYAFRTLRQTPLPFREPGRIVQVAEKNDELNLPSFSSSVLNFLSWREQTKTFEELAAIGFSNYTLTGSGNLSSFQATASARR